MEKGRLEGIGMGRSALILKMLKKRFGALQLTIEQKLNASGIDVLDRFGESIFDFKDVKTLKIDGRDMKNMVMCDLLFSRI